MKHFESFALDTSNECLWRSGTQIPLPPKPFAVLRYLVENPGRLITHDELLDKLWPETYVQPQVLRTYVLEIRKLLGDDASHPRFIQTLPKRGYCFVAPVQEQPDKQRGAVGQSVAPPNIPQNTVIAQQLGHDPNSAAGRAANVADQANAQPLSPNDKLGGLVGRKHELELLLERVRQLGCGPRRVIFVSGAAGIGKTALVDAFCGQLDLDSVPAPRLARGQCLPGLGGKEDYYPVMDALSQLCGSPDGETACRVLARMAPAWLALGRHGGQTVPHADRNIPQERLLGDLCAALEELATDKPLILIFEDLHWADDATLSLISALARRRAQAKLLVVATCRPRKGAIEHPLVALRQDLVMRHLGEVVELAPLSETAIAELLRQELLQTTLPEGLAAFVHRRSEGNALFALAILRHLLAERILARPVSVPPRSAPAPWVLRAPFKEIEASVPDELTQMIELEMEHLTPSEQCILEAASLMPFAFPAWAVAAALEMEVSDAEDACDALARRLYLVERAGQDELPDGTRSAFYVFTHQLYREVLYQRQAETRRAKRHLRVAARLRQLFRGREASVAREAAMHYEAAGDWLSAADALYSAAQRSHQRRAYPDAIELIEHALLLLENLGDAQPQPAANQLRRDLLALRRGLAGQPEFEAILSTKA